VNTTLAEGKARRQRLTLARRGEIKISPAFIGLRNTGKSRFRWIRQALGRTGCQTILNYLAKQASSKA
jgi:hypothetical protein